MTGPRALLSRLTGAATRRRTIVGVAALAAAATVLAVVVVSRGDDVPATSAADRSGAVATTSSSPSGSTATTTTPTPEPTTSSEPAPGSSAEAAEAGTAGTAGAGAAAGSWWSPALGASWQYQLSGVLDTGVAVDVVDADWHETTAAQVAAVHARGGRMVCYVNAGAYEDWRPDAAAFPAAVLGQPLDGWPGERWLDVRATDAVLPLIAARMDVCRSKGFDAVETDNVDGWANDTGFAISPADQLTFNRALADLAHARGLGIALKNDVEQVADLAPYFDFAVNEECQAYDECDAYRAFTGAGKAVLHVEYQGLDTQVCAAGAALGLSTIGKELDLGPGLQSC